MLTNHIDTDSDYIEANSEPTEQSAACPYCDFYFDIGDEVVSIWAYGETETAGIAHTMCWEAEREFKG